MRAIREWVIKILGEPNTVYLGPGVYRFMNHKGFLFFVNTQRIIPLGFEPPRCGEKESQKFREDVKKYWENYITQNDKGTIIHAIEKQLEMVMNARAVDEVI